MPGQPHQLVDEIHAGGGKDDPGMDEANSAAFMKASGGTSLTSMLDVPNGTNRLLFV